MLTYQHDDSGEWLAITDAARLVLVQTLGHAEGVARLWEGLTAGDDVQGVLDELTSRGLSNTPPFAVVSWDGDLAGGNALVRTIVRGDVDARLQTSAGPVTVSGRGVSTWVEQSHRGVAAFSVSAATSAGPVIGHGDARELLPLVGGAVRTRWIATASEGAAAAPPASELTVAGFDDDLTPARAASADMHLDTGYDHLFGATLMRGVEQAAVRPDDPDEAPADLPAAGLASAGVATDTLIDPDTGDHDGFTVMSGEIQKLRDSRRRPVRPAPHVAAPAPRLSLLLPNGSRELLTQPVLVGRSPSVSKVSGGHVPRLVSLGSADQDISRNHVQFQVEGDTVVVTDLHSRNGTIVVLPGKPPQKLRQGEPTSVIVGTVVDLGGGVTLTVCED
jgi:FHA domain